MIDSKIAVLCETSAAQWRLVSYAANVKMPYHEHDYSQFTLVLAGAFQELTYSKNSYFQAYCVDAKPVNFAHGNQFGDEGALLLSINFLQDPKDENDRLIIDRWEHVSQFIGWHDWNLLLAELMTSSGEIQMVEELTNDLLVAIDNSAVTRKKPPQWLVNVKEALCETEDNVVDIANSEGVHRVYLARVFRKYFGISPTQFRSRQRVLKAISMIAHGKANFAEVAARTGFFDQSHLNRSVQKIFDVSPKKLLSLF